MRERNEHLGGGAAGLGDAAEGLFELVFAELDLQGTDDRHRNDRGAGQHLLRSDERREIDLRHAVAESQCFLAGVDRFGVVLPRPALHLHLQSLRGPGHA